MDNSPPNDRLSQVQTSWTLLMQAHQLNAPEEAVRSARGQLLEQYAALVRRYLGALLRDQANREEAVEDCFQEFALRFLRGGLKGAAPERGRFRYYLKTCLVNLAHDHRRGQRFQARPLDSDDAWEPAVNCPPGQEAEHEFLAIWREELVSRALQGLKEWERRSGKPLYTVLRFRMDRPEARSEQMAEYFAARLSQPITAAWVRKKLHQAREKLAELLRAEVGNSLDKPTPADVDQELAAVGLLGYCRPAEDRGRNHA